LRDLPADPQRLTALDQMPATTAIPSANFEAFKAAVTRTSALPSGLRGAIASVGKAEHKSPDQFGFGLPYENSARVEIPIGAMMLEAQKSAMVAQAQLESDRAAVDAFNADVSETNGRVAGILGETTGQQFGESGEAWRG